MKQSACFLLFGLLLVSVSCKVTNPIVEDTGIIMWSEERPLAWSDFRGPVAEDTRWGAVTVSFLAYRIIDKNKTMVAAWFNKDQSWRAYERPDLLIHEQYHFKITELCAREMRKIVTEKKIGPKTNEFIELYSNQTKLCNAMQKEYDDITFHGQNKEQQALQEQSINEKLKALEAFRNPIIEF
ncbi:hypothetical protein LK994_09795 [Ferruginibacter lapsinanis]|uniref:hypothetical protein n=1 Tax=Ferruginibacter lapsinanis TaxID=563172 RepID=UPI001E62ADD2|nr:hypothetical protein [Ferruginibacter lapsinanis]UEG48928.1 hypothetical protein LK994_09795 [Ferruginibacter lapsinanis]